MHEKQGFSDDSLGRGVKWREAMWCCNQDASLWNEVLNPPSMIFEHYRTVLPDAISCNRSRAYHVCNPDMKNRIFLDFSRKKM
jgi:hypothetical protein